MPDFFSCVLFLFVFGLFRCLFLLFSSPLLSNIHMIKIIVSFSTVYIIYIQIDTLFQIFLTYANIN